jgi:hypothetical protein
MVQPSTIEARITLRCSGLAWGERMSRRTDYRGEK